MECTTTAQLGNLLLSNVKENHLPFKATFRSDILVINLSYKPMIGAWRF